MLAIVSTVFVVKNHISDTDWLAASPGPIACGGVRPTAKPTSMSSCAAL
jgi:hypothetical protein